MASSEVIALFRARVRDDNETVDRLSDQLEGTEPRVLAGQITAVFGLAVHRRFTATSDASEIVRFVADFRNELDDPNEVPPTEAETLIRAALGDGGLAESIPLDVAIPAQIALAVKILQDENLSDLHLEKFLNEAEALAARYSRSPGS